MNLLELKQFRDFTTTLFMENKDFKTKVEAVGPQVRPTMPGTPMMASGPSAV
jgi:hypothetical protein